MTALCLFVRFWISSMRCWFMFRDSERIFYINRLWMNGFFELWNGKIRTAILDLWITIIRRIKMKIPQGSMATMFRFIFHLKYFWFFPLDFHITSYLPFWTQAPFENRHFLNWLSSIGYHPLPANELIFHIKLLQEALLPDFPDNCPVIACNWLVLPFSSYLTSFWSISLNMQMPETRNSLPGKANKGKCKINTGKWRISRQND